MANKRELLHNGKAKQIFATDVPGMLIIHYKDDATAFNGLRRGTIIGKGVINNAVSAKAFEVLERNGIRTHFMRRLDERESLIRKAETIDLEVIVRNVAAGSLCRRLGLREGTKLPFPVLEFFYRSDELGDPMLNEYHIAAAGLATHEELAEMKDIAFRVNDLLRDYLSRVDIDLIDFKLEFGRSEGRLVVADEISPDTCRLWDSKTGERLDKDRFRREMEDVEAGYQEVFRRLTGGMNK